MMWFFKRSPKLAGSRSNLHRSMNEVRRGPHKQGMQFGRFGGRFPEDLAEVALWNAAVSGDPSFVAVVQSTDLGHRHDRPDFRRLNGS
jgi:hypothetical protein